MNNELLIPGAMSRDVQVALSDACASRERDFGFIAALPCVAVVGVQDSSLTVVVVESSRKGGAVRWQLSVLGDSAAFFQLLLVGQNSLTSLGSNEYLCPLQPCFMSLCGVLSGAFLLGC